MATKFIGIDGFGEIQSLKSERNSKKNKVNAFVKKAVRFAKRVAAAFAKSRNTQDNKARISRKRAVYEAKRARAMAKAQGTAPSAAPAFDFPKFINTTGKSLIAPAAACAVLVLTICFWTCSDSYLAVSYEGQDIAVIENEQVLTAASARMNRALSGTDENTTSVPVMRVTYPYLTSVETATVSDVYEKMVGTNDAVTADAAGLFVDGTFYGATDDTESLEAMLSQYLLDAKAKYDDTTTSEFNNSVEVVTDVYDTADIMSAHELFDSARDSLSVRIETDYIVEETIAYGTIEETDDSRTTAYREVKTEGKEGVREVFYRLVYVDGMMADCIYQSDSITTEAIDEVVVVGTKPSYEATGSFMWPVPYTTNITSYYGPRWGTIHTGIDIAASGCYGTDIVASDAGTVVFAGSDYSGYGTYVIIDHGNGYKTLYGHCSQLYVSVGQKVMQGETIAALGNTGWSTGPHLHFEVRQGDSRLDPMNFL